MTDLPAVHVTLLPERVAPERWRIDAMTPESDTSTHYFWGMARNFDVLDVGFTARFKAQQASVFREDVAVLEAQQRSILRNPHLKLKAFGIDSGGVRARHVIERMIRAQQPSDSAEAPESC